MRLYSMHTNPEIALVICQSVMPSAADQDASAALGMTVTQSF